VRTTLPLTPRPAPSPDHCDLFRHHPALHSLSADLDRTDTWRRWCAADTRLAGLATLDDAIVLRATPAGRRENAEQSRHVIAALVERASARGGDDPEAALAVVVLLADGIAHVARQVEDLCDPADVVDTLWERVRAATPHQGPAAASFLLRRTRETLVLLHQRGARAEGGTRIVPMAAPPEPEPAQDPADLTTALSDLVDLLNWAARTRVIDPAEADLLLELVGTSRQVTAEQGETANQREVLHRIAERRGVCPRTLRRRRQRVIARLREAGPAYLAAVS
jgi:hypothetical protein